MAEAVDRLQLVADHDQLGLRPAQRLDQPQLQPVGVLELVDEDLAEARAVVLADLGPLQQARGENLQVLEVDPGPPFLRRLEAGGEELQQLGQVAVDDAALARLREPRDRRVDRLPVWGERPSTCLSVASASSSSRPGFAPGAASSASARSSSSRSVSARLPLLSFSSARHSLGGGRSTARSAASRVGPGRLGQPRVGDAAAAQLVVDGGDHRPQPFEVDRRRRSPRGPGRPPARNSTSASSKASRAARAVSGASSTRKPGSTPAATGWAARTRLQKPWIVVTQAPPIPARAARRALRTALGPPRQLGPDPLPQLGRGLVGEGEGEDRVGREAAVADEAAVAVDHHPGLAGPGAGLEQDVAAADGDRRGLLGGRLARRRHLLGAHRSSPSSSCSQRGARSRRQIGAKVH